MKISEMTKHELYLHMKASRMIHRYDATSPEWKHAFKLAKANGMENMDMSCGSCIKKVTEWLQR